MNKFLTIAIVFVAGALFAQAVDEEGGTITVWPKNPGRFLFVNTQNRLGDAVLTPCVSGIASEFSIDASLCKGERPDLTTVPAALESLGAKGAIWIIDDPAMPLTLAASESGWGMLNVAPILSDTPEDKRLMRRTEKVVLRLFATLHGIGDAPMMPGCVMKPAVGISGIDELKCRVYSPESHMKVANYLAMAGYKQCKSGTYYEACEEGWAPMPTNDVQRAIWDKVHQLPTNPIRILPPSKRK